LVESVLIFSILVTGPVWTWPIIYGFCRAININLVSFLKKHERDYFIYFVCLFVCMLIFLSFLFICLSVWPWQESPHELAFDLDVLWSAVRQNDWEQKAKFFDVHLTLRSAWLKNYITCHLSISFILLKIK
jgi:hypothetical protein